MSEPIITIPEKEYLALLRTRRKLVCLESWGVDNWNTYDVAMREFYKGEGEDDGSE